VAYDEVVGLSVFRNLANGSLSGAGGLRLFRQLSSTTGDADMLVASDGQPKLAGGIPLEEGIGNPFASVGGYRSANVPKSEFRRNCSLKKGSVPNGELENRLAGKLGFGWNPPDVSTCGETDRTVPSEENCPG
jgi:hypothetical protein